MGRKEEVRKKKSPKSEARHHKAQQEHKGVRGKKKAQRKAATVEETGRRNGMPLTIAVTTNTTNTTNTDSMSVKRNNLYNLHDLQTKNLQTYLNIHTHTHTQHSDTNNQRQTHRH